MAGYTDSPLYAPTDRRGPPPPPPPTPAADGLAFVEPERFVDSPELMPLSDAFIEANIPTLPPSDQASLTSAVRTESSSAYSAEATEPPADIGLGALVRSHMVATIDPDVGLAYYEHGKARVHLRSGEVLEIFRYGQPYGQPYRMPLDDGYRAALAHEARVKLAQAAEAAADAEAAERRAAAEAAVDEMLGLAKAAQVTHAAVEAAGDAATTQPGPQRGRRWRWLQEQRSLWRQGHQKDPKAERPASPDDDDRPQTAIRVPPAVPRPLMQDAETQTDPVAVDAETQTHAATHADAEMQTASVMLMHAMTLKDAAT